MISCKQEILDLIRKLPDDVDYDDIMSEIYFKQVVEKSLNQINEGKVISHDEARKRLAKWIR